MGTGRCFEGRSPVNRVAYRFAKMLRSPREPARDWPGDLTAFERVSDNMAFITRRSRVLLPISLLCRETISLMVQQLRDTDGAFEARAFTSIPNVRLTDCIEYVSEDYLREIADTLMCRSFPLRSPRLIPPPGVGPFWLDKFKGVHVRLCRGYDVRLGRDIYRFDAQYQPIS